MATVPLSASSVRFISGVPFLNDYNNVRWFTTKAEQDTYFNAKTDVHAMTATTFQRNEKGAFIKANCSVDKLYHANYVLFINPDFGNKMFYGFINHLEFVNIGTTNVYIEIDVMQTWMFDYSFKPSFIDRQHCKLWESDGSPVINTIAENLDYGTEYNIVTESVQYPSNFIFLVIVTSKAIGRDINGTILDDKPGYVGSPSPLYYYVVPIDRELKEVPARIDGKKTLPLHYMNQLFSVDTEIVNAIQTMYLTDWCGITFYDGEYRNQTISIPDKCHLEYINMPGGTVYDNAILHVFDTVDYFDGKELIYVDKYDGLPALTESKLYMYPYTIYELDDLKGNRLTFKGEYVDGADIHLAVRGNVGYANRMSYELYNYNGSDGRQSSYQQAVIDTNPNDVPVVSSYLAAYMQGNKNSLMAMKNNTEIRANAQMLHSFGSAAALATSATPASVGAAIVTAGAGIISRYVDIQATENTVNGYISDATNVPPSVAKMGGNTSYDYGNGLNGIRVIKKQIKPEYQNIIANYFNKYGYKVHRVLMPNLHTRAKWNYIKTVNATIIGNINNDDLKTIKNIFDSGVTLWHVDDIGNYLTTNEVI